MQMNAEGSHDLGAYLIQKVHSGHDLGAYLMQTNEEGQNKLM